jgi:hypothetical protein
VRRRALYCLAFVAALPLVGELSLFQRFVPVLFSMAAVGLIGLSGQGDGAMPWDRDFRIHNREKLLGISTPALLYFLAGVTATLATIDIAALNLQVISQHVVPLTLFTITVALLAFWSLRNRYTVSGDSDLLGYDFGAVRSLINRWVWTTGWDFVIVPVWIMALVVLLGMYVIGMHQVRVILALTGAIIAVWAISRLGMVFTAYRSATSAAKTAITVTAGRGRGR